MADSKGRGSGRLFVALHLPSDTIRLDSATFIYFRFVNNQIGAPHAVPPMPAYIRTHIASHPIHPCCCRSSPLFPPAQQQQLMIRFPTRLVFLRVIAALRHCVIALLC
mmetsp:Transcript_11335/g.32060  ORF Transcript_11335/g.32060 Transcript_11335/m.32060 type:complete len:108 (+) Transcript_11335:105-428(+)